MKKENTLPNKIIFPFAMWGILFISLGFLTFLTISVFSIFFRLIFDNTNVLREIIWLAGCPVFIGTLLVAIDLVFCLEKRRTTQAVRYNQEKNKEITVVLTAYNDEASIGKSVEDFREHLLVKRVIVVDNNSTDKTKMNAEKAGAIVVNETLQGYGHCVYRALKVGAQFHDSNLIALCEGDMTFRAADLDKLIQYISHADIVNGTRIVEQLRDTGTQLTNFMYWGNFLGAKLLEIKHLGRGTITDLGTTYKLVRTTFLTDHLELFDPSINLEFNAHFLDTCLKNNFQLVEVPICFYPRIGLSKGGNSSNLKAISVGLGMLIGIIFSWKILSKSNKHG